MIARLIAFVTLYGAANAASSKGEFDTWYIYGSAELAGGKAIVYTAIIPFSISNADESKKKTIADQACAKLKLELKEFVERELNRKVTTVSAMANSSRTYPRDHRDLAAEANQKAGMRIIYLNGFKFSPDTKN